MGALGKETTTEKPHYGRKNLADPSWELVQVKRLPRWQKQRLSNGKDQRGRKVLCRVIIHLLPPYIHKNDRPWISFDRL